MMRSLILMYALIGLAGCSWGGADHRDDSGRSARTVAEVIADLPDVEPPPPANGATETETLQNVIARYEQTLPDIQNADTALVVKKRLADLRLQEQTRDLRPGSFDSVIADYEALLQADASPQVKEAMNVSIRYQLARARELNGQADAAVADLDELVRATGVDDPSPVVLEAMFRRGESAFSRNQYRAAAEAYEHAAVPNSPYRQHALYMLGWSRLKLAANDAALEAFVDAAQTLEDSSGAERTVSEQELLADTLRASVLSLERQDGVSTLARLMAKRGKPDWQTVFYIALGKSYLDQQRYQDAARAFESFEVENPVSKDAPSFALLAFEALKDGGFPSELQGRRPLFVERYGRDSAYHRAVGDAGLTPYLKPMREFVELLAASDHAAAQEGKDQGRYLRAAKWYRIWLTNFDASIDGTWLATDSEIGETMFLLGETLTAGSDFRGAVPVYKEVLERFPEHARAREAGYAAVLGLTQLATADPNVEDELLKFELDYAQRFSSDPRAPAVQMHAAQAYLTRQDYVVAASVAEDALARFALNGELANAARQIAGSAQYARGEFSDAEAHYRAARDLTSDPEQRGVLEERLLASVDQQAKQAESSGEVDQAIAHFRRIAELAPDKETAADALLNVAALETERGNLTAAAQELEAVRQRYPNHTAVAELPLRLADLYEKLEQPALAAAELGRVSEAATDPEVARSALYRAAELYVSANANAQAAAVFEQYVARFPNSKVYAAEALAHLTDYARANSDHVLARRWRDKQIALHANALDADERTRFLTAGALINVAEDERAAFEQVRLTQPINTSLKQKRAALDRALASFERASQLRVQQVATAATLQMGEMYERLSADVRASERPPGLSEQVAAQYETVVDRQADEFAARAVEFHRVNAQRAREQLWDDAIMKSFAALARLVPDRYQREEVQVALVSTLD